MPAQTVHTITKVTSQLHPADVNWAAFVTDMTRALAWPLLFAMIAVLFRNEMASLLAKLGSFEGFGMKMNFAAAAEKLAEDVAAAQQEEQQAYPEQADEDASKADDRTTPQSDDSEHPDLKPSNIRVGGRPGIIHYGGGPIEFKVQEALRVLDSWTMIENGLAAAASEFHLPFSRSSLTASLAALLTHGLLSENTLEVIEGARELRNAVAHGATSRLTPSAVETYEQNARAIQSMIHMDARRYRQRRPKPPVPD